MNQIDNENDKLKKKMKEKASSKKGKKKDKKSKNEEENEDEDEKEVSNNILVRGYEMPEGARDSDDEKKAKRNKDVNDPHRALDINLDE
jgi:hypothetical protein